MKDTPSKWTRLESITLPVATAMPQPIVTQPIAFAPPVEHTPAPATLAPFEQIEALHARIEAQFRAELEALQRSSPAVQPPVPITGRGYRTIVIDFKDKPEDDEREKVPVRVR